MSGYQPFRAFQDAFELVAGGHLEKREYRPTDRNVADFVRRYGKVATKEVAEAFDLLLLEAGARLARLKEQERLA